MPLPNDQLQKEYEMATWGKPTAPDIDPAGVTAQLQQALLQQRRADEMSYAPDRKLGEFGWGSALAELARPFVAKRNMNKANEGLAKALGQKSDLAKHEAALEEYKANVAEARKRMQDSEDMQREEIFKAGLKPPTDFERYKEDPEAYAQYKAAGRSPGTTVNVNGGKGTPFEEAADKKGADLYSQMQTTVAAFPKMRTNLQAMEQIAEKFKTGRIEDVQAALGAWLGTDAGKARDVWNANLTPLKLALAESISGPMTEGEWAMLEKALPNFGSDVEATNAVISLIRSGMERQMENYRSATEYSNANGHLRGWEPPNAMNIDMKESGDVEDIVSIIKRNTPDE
jgi:hypothetical protein